MSAVTSTGLLLRVRVQGQTSSATAPETWSTVLRAGSVAAAFATFFAPRHVAIDDTERAFK